MVGGGGGGDKYWWEANIKNGSLVGFSSSALCFSFNKCEPCISETRKNLRYEDS